MSSVIDWNTVAGWILPPGGAITVITLLLRYLVRRHRGTLTRASAQNERADKAERTSQRLYDYIETLRNQWPEGHQIPPWPRGLKPKE